MELVTKPNVVKNPAEDIRQQVRLPETLALVGYLDRVQSVNKSELFNMLDRACEEVSQRVKAYPDYEDAILGIFWKHLIFVGDISRQPNYLKELGIQSEEGGLGKQDIFRAILVWWLNRNPELFAKNLRVITEHTRIGNLFYGEIRSHRWEGRILSIETINVPAETAYSFLRNMIAQYPSYIPLIAKELPGYDEHKSAKTVKKIKKEGKFRIPDKALWVKHRPKGSTKNWGDIKPVYANGAALEGCVVETLEKEKRFYIQTQEGDEIKFPRKKQKPTIDLQKQTNEWILGFIRHMKGSSYFPMGTLPEYKAFRSKQNTVEQKFASQSIRNLTRAEFADLCKTVPAGAMRRMRHRLTTKENNKLVPRPKWGNLGKWLIEIESEAAQQLREIVKDETKTAEQKKVAAKAIKTVKTTGIGYFDLFMELLIGKEPEDILNMYYDKLVAMTPQSVMYFPFMDISASMINVSQINYKGVKYNIAHYEIACLITMLAATQCPVEQWRNIFGVFSQTGNFIHSINFEITKRNRWSTGSITEMPPGPVLDHTATFTENWKRMKNAWLYCENQIIMGSTDPRTMTSMFVDSVKEGKVAIDELPPVLIGISDAEFNWGSKRNSSQEVLNIAQSIEWTPLVIVWDVVSYGNRETFDDIENLMYFGGFNFQILSQIFSLIKNGPIDVQTRLWTINENPRYNGVIVK